jgi:UDP-glucose 4-epimerase
MVKVLVTGGAGYIGSHTAYACLEAGFDVLIVDDLSNGVRNHVSPDCAFQIADIGDATTMKALIESSAIDAIIHFAGSVVVPESINRPVQYYQNNTSKSLSLADVAVRCGVKALVFSSTAAVYAPTNANAITEDAPKGPLSPYGHSKLMTEQMLADIAAISPLRVGVLRYFNVAGCDPIGRTGQSAPNATHLIKVAVQTALGLRERLSIFGTDYDTPDGTCIRDFIHVSDLAEAHVLAVRHLIDGGANFTANCGYGRGASVLEVVRTLEAKLGRELPVTIAARRPGDAPKVISDPNRLFGLLPWRPRFDDIGTIVASSLRWEETLRDRSAAERVASPTADF